MSGTRDYNYSRFQVRELSTKRVPTVMSPYFQTASFNRIPAHPVYFTFAPRVMGDRNPNATEAKGAGLLGRQPMLSAPAPVPSFLALPSSDLDSQLPALHPLGTHIPTRP